MCPECGRDFDPDDARTYLTKPPFVWWTYWLPAFLLAGIGGGVLWLLLVIAVGYGWATTIVMPMALGAMMGYGARSRTIFVFLLSLVVLAVGLSILAGGGAAGGFCILILALLAIIPVAVGMIIGVILRTILVQSNFSQRDYLRSILIQVMIVCVPVAAAMIEGRHPQAMPVWVSTTQVVNAPPMQAWHGIQFFEEVKRPVPWLLWASPSLRPVYAIGHSEKVGDLKTCIYRRGKLIKQITEVIPGKRLAFRVVEQDRIENDGAKLVDGSFELRPIDGGRKTQVTLTTGYVPLLEPRFAYRWGENWVIHTLHGHVLAGMRDTAEENVR